MPKLTLKVARIGNSRGVRLPAKTLARFGISDSVLMEERSDGILLRPIKSGPTKLSWAATAAAMAEANEDWSDWDALTDGSASIPWDDEPAKRIAESKAEYVTQKRAKKVVRGKKK